MPAKYSTQILGIGISPTIRAVPSLHNHAFPTASPILALSITNVQLPHLPITATSSTATGCVSGHFLVVAPDFADEVVEGVVDVDARLCGGLDEFAAKGTGECFSLYLHNKWLETVTFDKNRESVGAKYTLLRNLSLALQIALVAYNNDGEIIFILDPQNLLLERHDLLKTLPAGDAVHEQEALAGPHVLFAHRRVFFLAGCIEDV